MKANEKVIIFSRINLSAAIEGAIGADAPIRPN